MKKTLQSAKEAASEITDKVGNVVETFQDMQTIETEYGDFKLSGGIKNKGKTLKIEVDWKKDFVKDNVTLNINTGIGEINITSPQNSDKFHCKFTATKRF